jgi:hypothetical protein
MFAQQEICICGIKLMEKQSNLDMAFKPVVRCKEASLTLYAFSDGFGKYSFFGPSAKIRCQTSTQLEYIPGHKMLKTAWRNPTSLPLVYLFHTGNPAPHVGITEGMPQGAPLGPLALRP